MERTTPSLLLRFRSPMLWAAIIAILAVGVRVTAGARAVDDAYITFRYALNLSDGYGLVYNPGEAVLGTSAPAYAVLLAGAARLTGTRSIPELALAINATADGLSLFLVFLIARRLRLPPYPSLLASLLVALSPIIIRYSIGGMETSLLTTVLLSSTLLFLQGHRLAPFLLAGLAVWLRPDALAFGAALVITEGRRTHRLPWMPLAVILAGIGLETFLLVAAYGEPLPQSVLAKANQVYRVDPSTNFFQHIFLFSGLSLTGAQGFGARGLAVGPNPGLNALALAAFLPLATIWVAGAVRETREEGRALVIGLFPVLFTLAYTILGLRGGTMAEWYLVPLVPFWLLPLFSGLAKISRGLRRPVLRPVVWVLPLALLTLELSAFNLGRDPNLAPSLPLNVWTEREDLYLQAAEFLRDRAMGGNVVAASEIGALGYACQCRILDTVGLVSPSVTSYYPLPPESLVSNYAIPARLVTTLRPDYLVSLEVFLRRTLLQDQRFLEEYELVWQAPTDAFESRGMHVYARRSDGAGAP